MGYDGKEDSSRAQFYRAEARRLREKAMNMDSPEIRQAFEDIANQYELLVRKTWSRRRNDRRRAGRQCRSSRSLAALSALPAEPERPGLLPSAPRPDSWSNGPIGDCCPRREIVSAGAAKAGNFKRSIGRYSYQKSLRSVSRSRPAEVC